MSHFIHGRHMLHSSEFTKYDCDCWVSAFCWVTLQKIWWHFFQLMICHTKYISLWLITIFHFLTVEYFHGAVFRRFCYFLEETFWEQINFQWAWKRTEYTIDVAVSCCQCNCNTSINSCCVFVSETSVTCWWSLFSCSSQPMFCCIEIQRFCPPRSAWKCRICGPVPQVV